MPNGHIDTMVSDQFLSKVGNPAPLATEGGSGWGLFLDCRVAHYRLRSRVKGIVIYRFWSCL